MFSNHKEQACTAQHPMSSTDSPFTVATTPTTDSPEGPSTTNATPQTPRKTREILASTIHSLATEIDAGRLSLSDPIAALFFPNFVAIAIPPERFNLEQYLAHLRWIRTHRPDYHVIVTAMDTVVDEAKGTARVFCDFEISGVFEGVTKASVAVVQFRQKGDGGWLIWRYEAADGMDARGGQWGGLRGRDDLP